jgi:hypothetical protein
MIAEQHNIFRFFVNTEFNRAIVNSDALYQRFALYTEDDTNMLSGESNMIASARYIVAPALEWVGDKPSLFTCFVTGEQIHVGIC